METVFDFKLCFDTLYNSLIKISNRSYIETKEFIRLRNQFFEAENMLYKQNFKLQDDMFLEAENMFYKENFELQDDMFLEAENMLYKENFELQDKMFLEERMRIGQLLLNFKSKKI